MEPSPNLGVIAAIVAISVTFFNKILEPIADHIGKKLLGIILSARFLKKVSWVQRVTVLVTSSLILFLLTFTSVAIGLRVFPPSRLVSRDKTAEIELMRDGISFKTFYCLRP